MDNKIFILDGGLGTMLHNFGVTSSPELVQLNNPEILFEIHKQYIDSGSQIICANTFTANRIKIKDNLLKDVIEKGIQIAKKAATNNVKVALDIGPIGQMLEPNGMITFEEAYDIFKEIILIGKDADLILIETMSDLYEVKAAVLAAKENSNKPVFVSMTFEQDQRTFLGVSLSEMVAVLEGLSVDAIGLNCSLGPTELSIIAKNLLELTKLPVIFKPNAGLPDPKTGEYIFDIKDFVEASKMLYSLGCSGFGGCCGTTPLFIKKLSDSIKGKQVIERKHSTQTILTSGTKSVVVDNVTIIGERINPTGKKILKDAIKNSNFDYIIKQALEQIEAGAKILDVNISVPEVNEKEFMPKVIKALQSVVDVPLQIDSPNKDAIESGLRVYNGKALVNSVNGKQKILDEILPIVKKYGAAVVGLTLDENGIPKTANERYLIAEKIYNNALKHGINKEDIFIDCLTLTASASQEEVLETLKAIELVKKNLGLKTVLGVSNVSFGLPNRELINSTFLSMALYAGLDLPIINPNIKIMTDTIDVYNVLLNKDVSCKNYIAKNQASITKPKAETNYTIELAILNGLKDESIKITKQLLKTYDEMTIIEQFLMKSLDIVGDKFEKGELFLPSLLQSAVAAQGAFDTVKESLILKGTKESSKGKIILATVEGDIHDIGKNIVKVILSNYGYDIIDLGKDVSINLVVETAKRENASLIGLSALMTTTLKNMEQTIIALKQNNITSKIVVGGAVLTESYAKTIGADYYAKDAKSAVDIAKEVFFK